MTLIPELVEISTDNSALTNQKPFLSHALRLVFHVARVWEFEDLSIIVRVQVIFPQLMSPISELLEISTDSSS
jgi:hypothetical protein